MIMTEQDLWAGEPRTLANTASRGKVVAARYRVTTEHVYVSTGMLRTNEQQVPLRLVSDVDVKASMTQKARHVGDVVVRARHSDGLVDTLTLESVADPKAVRDLINSAAHDARQREIAAHNQQQITYAAAVPTVPAPVAAPAASGTQLVMDQLRQLGELRDAGVITGEDFEQKKKDLLSRI
jgi:hypothetical protein